MWIVKLGLDTLAVFNSSPTKKFDFSITPDPSDGRVLINTRLHLQETVIIKVLDLSGRVLYSENIGDVSGTFTKQLDLRNFSSGTYLLQMIHNGQHEVKQLVIDR